MPNTTIPSMMPITIEIMGGLGNQLFQIFTLIAYSRREKRPFYFEACAIKCGHRKKTYWTTPLLAALKRFVQIPRQQQQLCIYNEPFFHYQEIPSRQQPLKTIDKLHGYFQSYKYFEKDRAFLLSLLNVADSQRQASAALMKTDYNTKTATTVVAIHFRVGDYKHQPQNHPLQPLAYYQEALCRLTSMMSCEVAIYFCEKDDEAFVKQTYIDPLMRQFPLLEFRCVDHTLADWEQLLLFSVCDNHIIANSSFSWWGAYLHPQGQGQGQQQVFYPGINWFGPNLASSCNVQDMCLPHWTKIIV